MTETVPLRLTQIQMAQIWPGLNHLVLADTDRRENKTVLHAYPFKVYPPSPTFDRGTYHLNMMEEILALREELQPRSAKGGRVHANAIQIRAAIFAVRINLAGMRWLSSESKKKKRIGQNHWPKPDKESFAQTRRRSRSTISSLERHLKRANRLLRSIVTPDEYGALMSMWKEHLRWMRLHLAYFQPSCAEVFLRDMNRSVLRARRIPAHKVLSYTPQRAHQRPDSAPFSLLS